MRSTALIVLAVALIPAKSLASANCQHSHSWQCQGQVANSGGQSQTGGSGISATGNTPNPGTTNPVLGSGTQTTPMINLIPATPTGLPPIPIKPPKKQVNQAPPSIPPNQAPGQVINPINTPKLKGNGQRPTPQIIAIQAPPLTGIGKLPTQSPAAQTPTPPVTGNSQPPIVINPIPSPTIIGQGKAPTVVGTAAPAFTGYGPVPQQPPHTLVPPPLPGGNLAPPIIVKPLPSPTLVGQGKVPSPGAGNQAPPLVINPTSAPAFVGYGKAPVKPAIQTPPLVPQPTPQVTAQAYLVPPQTGPGSNTPAPLKGMKVPHQTHGKTVTGPQQQPPVNPPAQTGQGATATHWIVSAHPKATPTNTHAGAQQVHGEVVEPGIQNREVTVYRSEDATQVVYNDVIPMDRTGFFLTVVGIREPHFQQPKDQLPKTEPQSFVFFFDYASAEIYRDQLYLIDDIASRYRATGQRVIVMGETDGFGNQAFNTQLAIHRSNMVIDRLVEAGIPVADIELKIYVRCCRVEAATELAVAATEDQRITWVTFQE